MPKRKVDPKDREKIVTSLSKYIKKKNINDPRKIDFLKYYFDPLSDTFSNGLQSAIKAGFTPQYAKIILSKNAHKWIAEYRTEFRERLFNTAEKRLAQLMFSDSDKVAADITKFTLERLGKDVYSPKIVEEVNHTVTHRLDDDQMERIAKRMNERFQK